MKKRISVWMLCILLLSGSVAGCSSVQSTDNSAYVMSLGIDIGEEKAFAFTFQIPYLINETGASEQAKFYSITCEAASLSDAIGIINSNTTYSISLSSLNFFVISDRVATREVLERLLPSLMKLPQLKKSAFLIVAKDSAKDYIEGLESDKQSNLDKIQSQLIQEADTSGIYPKCTLLDAFECLLDDRMEILCALGAKNPHSDDAQRKESFSTEGDQEEEKQVLASLQNDKDSRFYIDYTAGDIVRKGGLGSDLMGSAVFLQGDLKAYLTGRETLFVQMANGAFRNATYYMEYPPTDGSLMLHLKQDGSPKTKVSIQDGTVQIDEKIPLKVEVYSYTGLDRIYSKEEQEQMRQYIQTHLQQGIEQMVEKLQNIGADVFGYGRDVCKLFSTQEAWEDFQWRQHFPNAQVSIEVALKLERMYFDPQEEVQ